jgi:starch phosphorylase
MIRLGKGKRKMLFNDKDEFAKQFTERIIAKYGKSPSEAHIFEKYDILGEMVRDYAGTNWRNTRNYVIDHDEKQLIYFSMEFLMGRLLTNNLMNLGIFGICKDGLAELGIDIGELEDLEEDAGLGNGGLGRLAACFMDSLASLGYPGNGNCIRYEYGFFKQKIVDEKQIELPDQWLQNGFVWEVRKPKHSCIVEFNGNAETYLKPDGNYGIRTVNATKVTALPYDVSLVGYKNGVANNLRLRSAQPCEENMFSGQTFEEYLDTLQELSHGLYPDDTTEHGKILRLRQQYFFVSAGIQSAIRGHLRKYGTLDNFSDKYVFQLNDTHPILAIPELMRLMMDVYGYGWDAAWKQVIHAIAYTNHTIMPEALEKWPVQYVQNLLPRIYMIIEEINRRFIVRCNANEVSEVEQDNMVIIKDGMIRMTNLAIIACFSINGVAEIHTKILENMTFKYFYKYFPEKFNNKTNGVTHRRWLLYANPGLSDLITSKIGDEWIKNPLKLEDFLIFADDQKLAKDLKQVKYENKLKLAAYVKKTNGIVIDPNSIFDAQIKRLHAYKRQLMNIFRIMDYYFEIKNNPNFKLYPHTFIFGAKAAPSYDFAKQIITLINAVANVVNNDPIVSTYIKVVFVENYGVSLAELIIPATDISEQISTAGKEASGTSNMKFMMNGALTLGTLDGANVEIHDLVKDDNVFIFGLKVADVETIKKSGTYNVWDVYNGNPKVRRVLDSLFDGPRCEGIKDRFRSIFDEIINHNDEYLIFKDFDSYLAESKKVDDYYLDEKRWYHSVVVNIAKSGYFSSDRTIEEYNSDIWHLKKIDYKD